MKLVFDLPDFEDSYCKLVNMGNLQFTHREIDVMSCIACGRTSKKSIASLLEISPRTVETHTYNILGKIDGSSWESIRDTIEYASEKSLYIRHYDLLLFHHTILKASKKLSKKNISQLNVILYRGGECANNFEEILKKILTYTSSFGIQYHLRIIDLKEQTDNPLPSGKNDLLIVPKELFRSSQLNVFPYSEQSDSFDLLEFLFSFVYEDTLVLQDILRYIRNCKEEKAKSHTANVSNYSIDKKYKLIILLIIVILSAVTWKYYYAQVPHHDVVRSELLLPKEAIRLPRQQLMQDIQAILLTSSSNDSVNTLTIKGAGGSGKTILARLIASEQNGDVWELNVRTKDELRISFHNLAYSLAFTAEDRAKLTSILSIPNLSVQDKQVFYFVRDKLRVRKKWMLIFDDAASIADIAEFLPTHKSAWGNGSVIITTRNMLLDEGYSVQVGELLKEEARELLLKITAYHNVAIPKKEEQNAFLSNVPLFPLDVALASVYLCKTHLSIDDYIRKTKNLLDDVHHPAAQDRSQLSYNKTRADIISISIEEIFKKNDRYKPLFVLLALTNDTTIPRSLLEQIAGSDLAESFVNELKMFAFIHGEQRIENDFLYTVHASTPANIKRYMLKKLSMQEFYDEQAVILDAIEILASRLVDHEDSRSLETLLGILNGMVKVDSFAANFTKKLKYILANISICLFRHDSNNITNDLTEFIKDAENSVNIKDTLRLANALSDLGEMYRYQAECHTGIRGYAEGIEYLKRSISLYKANQQLDTLAASRAMYRLANIYRTVGKYEEAFEFIELSIASYEENQQKSQGIILALETKAQILRDKGQYTQALVLLNQCLSMKSDYGKHPVSVLWTQAFIGNVQLTLGLDGIAQKALKHVLQEFEKLFSKTSSYYAWALANYAAACEEQYPEKAKSMLEEALRIYGLKFHQHQVVYKTILPALGRIHSRAGNFAKAKEYFHKSLNLMESHYGVNHVRLCEIILSLGEVAQFEKNFTEAEGLYKRALKILQTNQHTDEIFALEKLYDFYTTWLVQKDNDNTFDTEKAREYIAKANELTNTIFPKNSKYRQRIQRKYTDSIIKQ